MVSDDDGGIEKNSDYFGRRDQETRSMNLNEIDGRSDNYLAEIRRISAIKPANDESRSHMFGDQAHDEEFSNSRSRSPIDFASKDPFKGINTGMNQRDDTSNPYFKNKK